MNVEDGQNGQEEKEPHLIGPFSKAHLLLIPRALLTHAWHPQKSVLPDHFSSPGTLRAPLSSIIVTLDVKEFV
jgi:hypothetical protein